MLGKEHDQLRIVPDEDFTDAFLAFRSRVEEAIKRFFNAADPSSNPLWSQVKTLIAEGAMWLASFFIGEGVEPCRRDPNTFCLDPAPFKDMIDCIFNKSRRPDYEKTFSQKQSIKDLNKMKKLATTVMNVVVEHGPTLAVVQKQFYKGLVAVIDSIDVTDEKKRVVRKEKSYSFEVKRSSGAIVLTSYVSEFDGVVFNGCCSSSQEVEMAVSVKVWKFATARQLKEEYERLR